MMRIKYHRGSCVELIVRCLSQSDNNKNFQIKTNR